MRSPEGAKALRQVSMQVPVCTYISMSQLETSTHSWRVGRDNPPVFLGSRVMKNNQCHHSLTVGSANCNIPQNLCRFYSSKCSTLYQPPQPSPMSKQPRTLEPDIRGGEQPTPPSAKQTRYTQPMLVTAIYS